MTDLRRRYVDGLRRDGVLTRDDVARAFAEVPREVFVAQGFHGRNGALVTPDDPEFLETVYRNDVLVTKVVDGIAVSSSSQPSLMAVMLEALDLAPGARVLEIGAGTGYNAALMAALGARVTSVDVQADVVDRAGAALSRSGAGAVEVRLGDGYLGDPGGAPYHRVIVTVGVAGVSPRWLEQLAPGGFVLAPVRHAGSHPVLMARQGADGRVTARGVTPAGFMSAAGPLSARYPWAHPEPARGRLLPAPSVTRRGRWRPPLDVYRYYDLWFAAGAWDGRVTFAGVTGAAGNGGCALLDESGAGGAALMTDGGILAMGSQARHYANLALGLRERWVRAGEPTLTDWSAPLVPAGDAAQPILVPHHWTLDPHHSP